MSVCLCVVEGEGSGVKQKRHYLIAGVSVSIIHPPRKTTFSRTLDDSAPTDGATLSLRGAKIESGLFVTGAEGYTRSRNSLVSAGGERS